MRFVAFLFAAALSCSAATWEEKVVAAVIAGEARGEGFQGMLAVGEVIHQRSVNKRQAPLTVVLKPNAFSSKNGLTAEQIVEKYSSVDGYSDALVIARMVCGHPSTLPGITNKATHFAHKDCDPLWAGAGDKVAVIGNHAFYLLVE